MASTIRCDLAIVGGGLAGGLLALALRARHPDMELRLIEAGERLGGNHVWSFFGSDIAEADRWLLTPLVSHAWSGYDVAFPRHRRTLLAHLPERGPLGLGAGGTQAGRLCARAVRPQRLRAAR